MARTPLLASAWRRAAQMTNAGVALDCIEESIKSAADQSIYANRYALLTRGQLLGEARAL